MHICKFFVYFFVKQGIFFHFLPKLLFYVLAGDSVFMQLTWLKYPLEGMSM